ncbi:MAG TPA: HEAT repeat domain-containing protein [Allosphingosinicella sp.]|uniref:HEAT repeat domain-containing protein n=1 Tax=Allosphingosinicella sp. TaxID=2823234 RepID=UPI002ED9667A
MAKSTDELIEQLANGKGSQRRSAASALGKRKDKSAVTPLLQLLSNPRAAVRRSAAEALGGIGDKEAFKPLVALLDDPDWEVHTKTVGALGALSDPRAVPILIDELAREVEGLHRYERPDGSVINSTPEYAAAAALACLRAPESVAPLLDVARSNEERARWAAMAALSAFPNTEGLFEAIVEVLPKHDYHTAFHASQTLLKLDMPRAQATLTKLKNGPNPEVRKGIYAALAEQGDKGAELALLAIGDNEHVPESVLALDQPESVRLEIIARELEDDDRGVRGGAITQLSRMESPEALQLIQKASRSRHFDVRSFAVVLLASRDPVKSLGLVMQSFGEVSTRLDVIRKSNDHYADLDPGRGFGILGQIGKLFGGMSSRRSGLVDELCRELQDRNPTARMVAAEQLGGIDDPTSTEALLRALCDEKPQVRRAAAQALGKGERGDILETLLARSAAEQDGEVKAELIARIATHHAPEAAAAIEAALDDNQIQVRLSAARALCALGKPPFERLRALVGETGEAAELLAATGDTGVHILIDLLSVGGVWDRINAAGALERADTLAVRTALKAALSDADDTVRAVAANSLAGFGDPAAITVLLAQLRTADAEDRASAAHALAQIRNPESVSALIEALDDDDATVRSTAASALGALQSKEALNALEALRSDSDTDRFGDRVKDAAEEAVSRIQAGGQRR